MKHYIGADNPMRGRFEATAAYQARHFAWSFDKGVWGLGARLTFPL